MDTSPPRIEKIVVSELSVKEHVTGRVTRVSPEAPVPVMRVEKRRYEGGLAAAFFMSPSELLVGIVGDDPPGRWLCGQFPHLLVAVGATTKHEQFYYDVGGQCLSHVVYPSWHVAADHLTLLERRVARLQRDHPAAVVEIESYDQGMIPESLLATLSV